MAALPETPAPTRDAIFASYEDDADTGFVLTAEEVANQLARVGNADAGGEEKRGN